MTTLLEKAKASITPRIRSDMNITSQHIELAIAWAKDEITYTQVLRALFGEGKSGTMQAYVVLARSLRQAVREGIEFKAGERKVGEAELPLTGRDDPALKPLGVKKYLTSRDELESEIAEQVRRKNHEAQQH